MDSRLVLVTPGCTRQEVVAHLSCLQTSNPVTSGIMMSNRTRSGSTCMFGSCGMHEWRVCLKARHIHSRGHDELQDYALRRCIACTGQAPPGRF